MAYKFQEGLAKLDGQVSASLAIVSKTSFSGSGDVAVTGAVHAAQFYGGGAGITGISSDAVDVTGTAGDRNYPLVFTEAAQSAGTLGLGLDTSLVFNPSSNLLTAPGRVITDDTTDATSKTDGSLQTDGGLSVAKAIYNGTGATLAADSGIVTMGAATSVTVSAAGLLNVENTTDSTAVTNGALVVDGGVGVAKDVIVGNDVKLLSDSAVLAMGVGSDATFTHDGTTGLTIAASPISVDSTGELHLNSTTGDVKLQDGGTDQVAFDMDGTAGEIIMKTMVASDDFVFQNTAGQEQIRLSDTRGKMFLYDEGGEYLQSDGSAMTIAGGTGINLTAASGDVVIPVNIGLVLGDGGEKIESDNTDLTVTSGGDVVLDAADDIHIDAGGDLVNLKKAGTTHATFDMSVADDLLVKDTGGTEIFRIDGSADSLLMASTKKIEFNDASQFIHGSSATVLALGATDEIDLTATTIDINGAIQVDSTIGIAADTDLLTLGNAQLTLAGDLLATEGTISGASTIQAVGNTYLGGQLGLSGGLKFEISTVTAATELTASSAAMYHLVSGGTADITVRLPSASAGEEYQYVIKRHALMSGNVVITSSGGDANPAKQFDGENSITLESPGASVFLISDGAMWNIF